MKTLFSDPLLKILIKKSHITRTQLETLLIDILSEKVTGKSIVYEDKAKLRMISSGVSRGAFNRTLAQARTNIIKSIYTILLLGYIGIFESPCLDPYIEIANKIRNYTEAYKDAWKTRRVRDEHMRIISMLHKEIEKGLQELSEPKAISKRT
jgi:hypothetical protein